MKLAIHAGMHKTASTSLQNIVFPRLRGLTYIGKTRYIQEARLLVDYTSVLRHISNVPDYVLTYHLAGILDNYIATLPRLPLKSLTTAAANLKARLHIMRELKAELERRNPEATYLYSSEGIFLNMNHIFPDRPNHYPPITIGDILTKAFGDDIITTLFFYNRSPVDYLFSRYIQIHTVRLRPQAGSPADMQCKELKPLALKPKQFFELNDFIWQAIPGNSMYINLFPNLLVSTAEPKCQTIQQRSYESHICNTASITSEISTVLGIDFGPDAKEIDDRFTSNPVNTTAKDKKLAVDVLTRAAGHSNLANLKAEFSAIAQANPVVQQAVRAAN